MMNVAIDGTGRKLGGADTTEKKWWCLGCSGLVEM
jgi:hypothetical protein